jgi:hypothetical protein
MLPIEQALTSAPPTGGICGRVRLAVGPSLIGSALHRVNAMARQRRHTMTTDCIARGTRAILPAILLCSRALRLVSPITMASADFSRAETREISPGNCTLLCCTAAAFTSTGIPDAFGVLCHLDAPCRSRPRAGFLFISSQFSPGPAHGRDRPSRGGFRW